MIQIEEYSRKLESLKKEAKSIFTTMNYPYKEPQNNDKIHLVFVGQYSAGKSSILTMLTGRKDIKIGEGITTQKVTKYDWNGIEVIDTPGIHTELRPDHDAISYEAIASADLLVYVVSNELFDSNLGKRFRSVAIDKDKAGEMILVVNKMSRTVEGNVPHQQEVIKKANGLVDVISPHTPDELNISFLDSESYLDSLTENDKEIAEELRQRSGYDDFISTLNNFIAEKNLSSKLTTVIYQIDSEIEDALKQIESTQKDADIKALEENYRQQRHIFMEGRDSLRQEVSSIFMKASSEIKNLGIEAANSICNGCNEKDVELDLSEKMIKAQTIIEESQKDSLSIIEKKLSELNLEVETLENSEFSKELKLRLEGRMSGLPTNVKKLLNSGNSAVKDASTAMIKNAYSSKTATGLKLSNFSGSNIHDVVLKAGKTLGYKFKPWQAIKITKGIAIAGHVLTVFGVIFSVGMQIAEDMQSDEIKNSMEQNRINIRSQFNDAANGLENFGRNFISEVIDNHINVPIMEINDKIKALQEGVQQKNDNYKKLVKLQDSCLALIQEIHK